ncbi:protein of unknown function [Shewanella benthica]|uniref:Uncharacterized protein n=1 Tax=Shewanella benthica TaxID=43661 RepID=A0A330LXY9_9GAMM|nr:protein of unknown function [Shewanella benthica]
MMMQFNFSSAMSCYYNTSPSLSREALSAQSAETNRQHRPAYVKIKICK